MTYTEVTSIEVEKGKIVAVDTTSERSIPTRSSMHPAVIPEKWQPWQEWSCQLTPNAIKFCY